MARNAAQCLGPLIRFLPHARFTKVQEEVIPAVFTNSHNCLVAAPTGSGKTVLLEVAMLRLFRTRLGKSDGRAAASSTAPPETDAPCLCKQKAVYICPIKALANEKYTHWRAQFPSLTVVIETGDQRQASLVERPPTPPPPQGDGDGDGDSERMASVAEADILVTTPERWDSITRRWKEKEVMAIVNSVGLLMLDEVHTVQEERGAAMEAIVSRVKVIQASSVSAAAAPCSDGGTVTAVTRIVAVSGTLPNCRDLAEWLQVPPDMVFTFSPQDRPVPLTVRVISYPHDSSNPFAFLRFLSFKLFALMQQYSEGRPTLVFCTSRKETTSTAQRLVDDIRDAAARQGQTAQLQPSAEAQHLARQAADRQLRGCLLVGVGFHHAAMTRDDRELVERMFREQYIAVICATTTLALGVNLPAHLVIIKGTAQFLKGQCQDMPVSEVMQMCGRAGRPGFDTHGVAIVLATQRAARLYNTLANGAAALTCVESHLHRRMIEHVNAEVALRTVHSFATAMEWLRTTFFWIRLRKCPRHYGLEFATYAEEAAFNADAFAEALMERVLRVLVEEGCVTLHPVTLDAARANRSGDADDIQHPSAVFEATRLGRAMSRLYILFDSVCVLNAKVRERRRPLVLCSHDGDGDAPDEAGGNAADGEDVGRAIASTERAGAHTTDNARDDDKGAAGGGASQTDKAQHAAPFTLRDALQLLCHCQELVEVNLRQGDRGPLNELNKAIRYPLHSGRRGGREVREDWQKVYVLVQAHIGLLPLTEVSLRNDSLRLWAVVPRVARFLVEYAWAATTSYTLALHAHVLARAAERRVWPDGLVVRQLRNVHDAVAKALLRSGVQNFDRLAAVEARQLEVLCSRLPPFGSQVLEELRRLPRVQVSVTLASGAPSRRHGTVELSVRSIQATNADQDGGTGGKDKSTDWTVSRFLLVVGIPSEDTVVLKRVVPLSALTASPSGVLSFDFSLPPEAAPAAAQGRCVEARCLVERFLGLDTVAVAAMQPLCEPQHHTASRPLPSASQTPEAVARRTELSTQVAAEARRTFGELMADFTYVQGTATAEAKPTAGGRSRKRTRSCAKVPETAEVEHHSADVEVESPRALVTHAAPLTACEKGAAVSSRCVDGALPAAAEREEPATDNAAVEAATSRSGLPPESAQVTCRADGVMLSVSALSSPDRSPPERAVCEVPMPATSSITSASPTRRHRTIVRLQPCPSPPAARPLDIAQDAAVTEELVAVAAAPCALRTSMSLKAAPTPPPPQRQPHQPTQSSAMLFSAAPWRFCHQEQGRHGDKAAPPAALPAPRHAPYPLPRQEPRQSAFTVRVAPNAHAAPWPSIPPNAYVRSDHPVYYQCLPGAPQAPLHARGEAWGQEPTQVASWAYASPGVPADQAPWADTRTLYERGRTHPPAIPGYTVPQPSFTSEAAMRTSAPQPLYPGYPPYPGCETAWPQPRWERLPPQELRYCHPEQQLPQRQRGGLGMPPGQRSSVGRELSVPVSRGVPLHAATQPPPPAAPQQGHPLAPSDEWRVLVAGRQVRADTRGYPPAGLQAPLTRQSATPRYDGFAPHTRRSSMVAQSWWQ